MKISHILNNVNLKLTPVSDLAKQRIGLLLHSRITGVSIDTRKIRQGNLFVACKGATKQSAHGYTFMNEAQKNGAILIITDNTETIDRRITVPILICHNARIAAAVLSEMFYHFPSKQLRVCGITGTNGKTTVSFLLSSIQQANGKKSAVFGTLGFGQVNKLQVTNYTTPEAESISKILSSLHKNHFEDVAMEVSSHSLATHRVDGLNFDRCAFTNLSPDHLDFHENMEKYSQAKDRLFLELLGNNKMAILPYSHHLTRKKIPIHEVLTFGDDSKADVQLIDYNTGISGTSLKIKFMHQIEEVKCPFIGRFNVQNALCAATIAFSQATKVENILRGILDQQRQFPDDAGVVFDTSGYQQCPQLDCHVLRCNFRAYFVINYHKLNESHHTCAGAHGCLHDGDFNIHHCRGPDTESILP